MRAIVNDWDAAISTELLARFAGDSRDFSSEDSTDDREDGDHEVDGESSVARFPAFLAVEGGVPLILLRNLTQTGKLLPHDTMHVLPRIPLTNVEGGFAFRSDKGSFPVAIIFWTVDKLHSVMGELDIAVCRVTDVVRACVLSYSMPSYGRGVLL